MLKKDKIIVDKVFFGGIMKKHALKNAAELIFENYI